MINSGFYIDGNLFFVMTAQVLSKRIHYGKFVAEAKYQASPDAYKSAIFAQVQYKIPATRPDSNTIHVTYLLTGIHTVNCKSASHWKHFIQLVIN